MSKGRAKGMSRRLNRERGVYMVDDKHKEVYFSQYCPTCRHKESTKMHEDPCNECLDHPTNLYSHKPVKYEEK